MQFQEAVENVIENQKTFGADPKKPKTELGQEIYDCIKSYLSTEDDESLEFYCAIGTALDWYHGTDGFLRINKFIVCFDATVNPHKVEQKAILLDRTGSGAKLWRICKRIADTFNARPAEQKEPFY